MTRLAAMISQRIWRGRGLDLKLAATAGSLGLFGFPLLGGAVVQSGRHRDLIARWIPGALGGLAGFAAFHGIDQASGGSLQRMPYSWPSNLGDDLGTLSSGAIAGVVGWGLGWLLLRWRSWLALRHLLATGVGGRCSPACCWASPCTGYPWCPSLAKNNCVLYLRGRTVPGLRSS